MQARDSFGNVCQSGGDSFSVQIQGVAREDICVTDRHDGAYAVEYCVPAEGNYQASVTLDGAHVAGSPAPITAFRSVLPAAVILLIWYSRNQHAMLLLNSHKLCIDKKSKFLGRECVQSGMISHCKCTTVCHA